MRPRARSVSTAVLLCLAPALLASCAPHPDAAGHPVPGAPGESREPGPGAQAVVSGALESRQAEFLAALADRDLERATALFAEDAVLHVAGMPPVRGRAAIERFYGNVFRFMTSSTPELEAVRASTGGDMAWSAGRVSNVFAGPDGSTTHGGKFVLVWERRDATWLIVLYGVSSDA
jgi:uncharacterized protein (TIGR02246 family)